MSQLPLHCHREEPGPFLTLADVDPARWFDELADELQACELERALLSVQRGLRREFPHAKTMATPTLTGANALASRLHWPANAERPTVYPPLEHDLQVFLHTKTTQHRQAVYTLPETTSRTLEIYDRRLAYGAHLRHLPTLRDGVQHDTGDEYVEYRRGWYVGTATVPRDWAHVGILPLQVGDGHSWRWPDTPNFAFSGVWNWREVALALEHGWRVQIDERILFDRPGILGEDPARPFNDHLRVLLDQVERILRTAPTGINRAIRNALRHVLINPVGLFHRWPRVTLGIYAPAEAPPNPGDLTFVPLPDGRWQVERFAPPEQFHSRWHRPEWSAEIYAAARVASTRAALSVPREQLVAIYADAIFLTADPGWPDLWRIGDLRHEPPHTRARPRRVPASLDELWAIKGGEEAW